MIIGLMLSCCESISFVGGIPNHGMMMIKEVKNIGYKKDTYGDKSQRYYHARIEEPWTMIDEWSLR